MRDIKKGFSLIEVLIAISIFAVISVVSLDLYLASVKSSNKVRIINKINQNGQQIMGIIDSLIRNSITASFLGNSGLSLSDSDGNNWIINCVSSTVANGKIEIQDVYNSAVYPISDTNPVSGVDVSSCSFTQPTLTDPSKPTVVGINFVLQQGKNAQSRQDFQANVTFDRIVSLRSF